MSAIPAARFARVIALAALERRGRRECRVFDCTRSLVCDGRKHTSVVTTGEAETSAFPAQWLTAYLRALPGVHDLLVTVAREVVDFTRLAPAQGCQDHTTLPSERNAARLTTSLSSIASRRTFRDDAHTPLLPRRDARIKPLIWGRRQHDFRKSEDVPLRQIGTTGNLRMTVMPAVSALAPSRNWSAGQIN